MSSSIEEQIVTDLQSIRDQQLIKSFNNPFRVEELQVRSFILRSFGFGVVTMIGFNPVEAQIEDLIVIITHNKFISKVQIWVKMQNEQHEWRNMCAMSTIVLFHYLPCIKKITLHF
jgi:hypothetical protein